MPVQAFQDIQVVPFTVGFLAFRFFDGEGFRGYQGPEYMNKVVRRCCPSKISDLGGLG